MSNDIYKPVTEDSLREFYQQIQPYLNADVPVIANKFDKANLYSETERIVGQWVDGKPIYQKVMSLTSPSTNNQTQVGDISDLGIETVVKLDGTLDNDQTIDTCVLLGSGNGISCKMWLDVSAGRVWMRVYGSDYYSKPVRLILQYTKTADSAISIGADTDYSTTEKMIGTWIDGSPLYQKSYSLENVPKGAWTVIDASLANGQLRDCVFHGLMNYFVGAGDYNFFLANIGPDGASILRLSSYSNVVPCVLTLQYSKPT